MKKVSFFLLLVLLLCGLSLAGTLTYSADTVSRYIFRGMDMGSPVDFTQDPAIAYPNKYLNNNTPALQPGLTYTFSNGLSIGAWSSIGLGKNSTQKLDELDYTLLYPFAFKDVDYKVGYTHYTLPTQYYYYAAIADFGANDAKDYVERDEVSFGLALNKVFLAPSLTVYYDYDKSKIGAALDPLQSGADRLIYAYTELGFTFPTLPYGLTNTLTLGFDGTYGANGKFTNANYKVAKDLGSGFTGYTNLILLNGALAGGGSTPLAETDAQGNVQGDKDGNPKWDPKNYDNYEIVFGVNYTGSINL